MATSRRDALIIGGGLVAVAAGWQVFGVRPADLTFSEIEGASGWFFGSAGEVSGSASGADFLTIGLEAADAPPALPVADLEDAVFGQSRQAGHVPMAVFSDFFCPFCRILTGRLAKRLANGQRSISLAWHEFPLLGPNSVMAARAGVAAQMQGAYLPFQEALIGQGFRPSPQYLAGLAQTVGLDSQRFMSDMESDAAQAHLDMSAGAARTLGLIGTPGLVIGRRVVMGALDESQMEALITDTRAF